MGRKILVVVDMQNDFISGPLGNAECMAATDQVAEVIANGDYDSIFVTQDTHTEQYMETNEGRHLPVVHCVEGTKGWECEDRVKQALDTSMAEKAYFKKGTFGSLSLVEYLTDTANGIANAPETQIDFCGVCTGICVISNVMLTKAALPEADIRVLAQACACVTPESHKTALAAMQLCQVEIVGAE